METATQFGIITHAQIQNIDGRTFEFQPEHLMCDECWKLADTAFSHAAYFGSARAGDIQHNITVSRVKKVGAQ